MELSGQSVFITGGASGLGAATAERVGALGAKVTVVDLNGEGAGLVAERVGGLALSCDVTDEASVTDALARATAEFGPPRVVVNCAGIAPGARVVGREGPMPLEDFSRVIQVNLVGTFNVMRLAAKGMMDCDPVGEGEERGVIINTASVAAFEGQIGQAAYSASKGGVAAMTLPVARELAKFHIRVVTIAPGLMDTPMMSGMTDKVREGLNQTLMFPAELGAPTDYAKLAAHVVDNVLINGSVIRLDGAVRLPAK